MSDDELDREWKPNARPQSTMARSFSLALNDLFKIDNSLADLDAAVSEKKQQVSSQTSELEALEARLKATEERLKAAASARTTPSPNGRSSPRPRPPIGDTFANPQSPTKREATTSPLSSEFQRSRPSTGRPTTGKSDGRPGSGWQQRQNTGEVPQMPGALPPTPGASEGISTAPDPDNMSDEYVIVGREADLLIGEDGDVPPPPPPKSNSRPVREPETDSDDSN